MRQAFIWVIEVRDNRAEEWQTQDQCYTSRNEARAAQSLEREYWNYTRTVKYVREARFA